MSSSTEHPVVAGAVDVREFVDSAPFSLYQKLLLALCFLTTFFDGFDTQAIAVAGPWIRDEMSLQPAQLGSVFAAGSLGGIVAAFTMAPFADKIGRRPLIVGAMMAAGLLSLCYTFAETFTQLLALRFSAGVCLAIAVTVTYAYSAELAPKRAAATAVMVTSAGFGLGVAATGFISGWLIPAFGWKAIFYLGGSTTVVLSLMLLWLLPESIRVMAGQPGREGRVRRYLTRIQPQARFTDETRFYLNEERKTGVSIKNVLAQGRGVTSTALWVSFFFINFVIYVLMQWLPSFVTAGGGGAVQSGAAVAWFKMGGILGSFICAAYIDRRGNPYPILTAFLLLAAGTFVMLSNLPAVAMLFVVVVAVTGVLLSGPMYATNGLMGRLLPTYVRTGGLALTAGVGRMGAMTGPFTVGLMLQAGWTEQDLLMAAIVPTLLSAVIITGLGLRHRAIARQASVAA